MNYVRNPEADAIMERLGREGISSLFHFTSVENLPGISRQQALLSKEMQRMRNNLAPEPGGNALSRYLDSRRGNSDKVSLCLTPYTPMAWSIKKEYNLCYLDIDPAVAGLAGVVFTDSNATKDGHLRGEGLSGLNLVNFAMVKSSPQPRDPEWHRYSQAEILVPDAISLDAVQRVVFVSEPSRKYGDLLWGGEPKPNFEVDINRFVDFPGYHTDANFPHVKDIFLTNREVTKENVGGAFAKVDSFSKAAGGRVTTVVNLKATAGTKGRMTWSPIGDVVTEDFSNFGAWWWWHTLEVEKLPEGRCSVEISLDGVIWTRIIFVVEA